MKQQSVTTELKKSLKKYNQEYNLCFSDVRKNKTAVGVKICRFDPPLHIINKIIANMEEKGYEFIKTTIPTHYSLYNGYRGIRFTFFKKEYSFANNN